MRLRWMSTEKLICHKTTPFDGEISYEDVDFHVFFLKRIVIENLINIRHFELIHWSIGPHSRPFFCYGLVTGRCSRTSLRCFILRSSSAAAAVALQSAGCRSPSPLLLAFAYIAAELRSNSLIPCTTAEGKMVFKNASSTLEKGLSLIRGRGR